MIIYKATNKINNKCYIGQTIQTLNLRINRHKFTSKNGSNKFSRSIRKYGIETFRWTILEVCMSIEDLNEKEKYYIELFDSFNKGYNLTTGGDSHTRKPFTKEHKDRIGKSNLGKVRTEEHKDKVRKGNTGRKHKPDTIKKMKQRVPWNKGIPRTEEEKLKLSNSGKLRNDLNRRDDFGRFKKLNQ